MRAGSSWAKAPADATRSGVMPCTATASDAMTASAARTR